jgi:hypothetical protein
MNRDSAGAERLKRQRRAFRRLRSEPPYPEDESPINNCKNQVDIS